MNVDYKSPVNGFLTLLSLCSGGRVVILATWMSQWRMRQTTLNEALCKMGHPLCALQRWDVWPGRFEELRMEESGMSEEIRKAALEAA
jgi:hypothetical protein